MPWMTTSTGQDYRYGSNRQKTRLHADTGVGLAFEVPEGEGWTH